MARLSAGPIPVSWDAPSVRTMPILVNSLPCPPEISVREFSVESQCSQCSRSCETFGLCIWYTLSPALISTFKRTLLNSSKCRLNLDFDNSKFNGFSVQIILIYRLQATQ